MIDKWMIKMIKKETIQGKRLPIRRGSKKIRKEKRKIITVASTFINSEFNNNSPPQPIIL